MKNIVTLVFMLLFFEPLVQAQFLNKLKDKIQRGAENAVLDQAEKQTYKLTSKTIEKILKERFKNISMDSINFIPRDSLPANYQFNWNYQLAVNSNNDEVIMDYFLNEGAGYFGTANEQAGEMKMVFDRNLNAFITYMEKDGEKTAMAIRIPQIDVDEMEVDSLGYNSMSFGKTGNTKKIIGYDCEEYVGDSPDYQYTTFITQDAEIGFGDIFRMDNTRMPRGLDPELIRASEGLLMEMVMVDKDKEKNNMTMTCTKLEPISLVLDNDDYEFVDFSGN